MQNTSELVGRNPAKKQSKVWDWLAKDIAGLASENAAKYEPIVNETLSGFSSKVLLHLKSEICL